MNTPIRLDAHAKINIGLDVTGRRENGYHDVRMIMQTLSLCDTLVMERIPEDTILLSCSDPELPVDDTNLIIMAVKAIKEKFQIKEGAAVHVIKRIPIAAGMAGGSADAAAALKGMSLLFGLDLNGDALCATGVRLGADIPYCLMEGTALSEGIGEILTPLPPMPHCRVLIVKPPFPVSTQSVYERLDLIREPIHPDIDGIIRGLTQNRLESIVPLLGNILESVTIAAHPIIREFRELLMSLGALGSLMCGSGPSVFGLFTDPDAMKQAALSLHSKYPDLRIIETDLYNPN